MTSSKNSIHNKQFLISLCLTLVICLVTRPWSDYLNRPSLSSYETKKFNELSKNPDILKKVLLQKISKNPNEDYAWQLLASYYHHTGDQQNAKVASEKAMMIKNKHGTTNPKRVN